MKKILSMIVLVAVFGSSNVMADDCSDAVTQLKIPYKMSKVINLCRTNNDAHTVVIGAANNGYTFISTTNSILPNQAWTCHTNKSNPCTHLSKGKIILVNSSGANGATACFGGGEMSMSVEYSMLHELWHAYKGPGSGEAGAISNTNAIRKANGKTQRADKGATCY